MEQNKIGSDNSELDMEDKFGPSFEGDDFSVQSRLIFKFVLNDLVCEIKLSKKQF